MIGLPYSLVIEATDDPNFFCFYSPDLHGFTGVGHSVEDCIYKARHGMAEHIALLQELGKPIPTRPEGATILIRDSEPVAK
jgi:predicted RNase H-like HicB family nuclease